MDARDGRVDADDEASVGALEHRGVVAPPEVAATTRSRPQELRDTLKRDILTPDPTPTGGGGWVRRGHGTCLP